MVCAHIDFVRADLVDHSRDKSPQNNATAAECGNSDRRYEPKGPRNLRGPSSRDEIDRAWQILSMELPKSITPAAKVSQSQFSMEIPGQFSAEIYIRSSDSRT